MAKKLQNISRRDFLNGASIAIGAGLAHTGLSGCDRAQQHIGGRQVGAPATTLDGAPYPPALTGMRGSHDGSHETAHQLAWAGETWPSPETLTDDIYDLVIVGGGISGLAAAHFYRERRGADKRILILDNHDDFGGHAKRNEFTIDGRTIIGYGGSQSIDTPSGYSKVSAKLLRDIGVKTDRFYTYYDQDFTRRHGLSEHVFFDEAHYGENILAPALNPIFDDDPSADAVKERAAKYPISDEARQALVRLHTDQIDYLPDLSVAEKLNRLRSISYETFITFYVGLPDEAVTFMRRKFVGLWGMGWDALSAMEAMRVGMPGIYNLGVGERGSGPVGQDEPYIFHFPDGNASIARLLVRKLIPETAAGQNMEDVVTAKFDYTQLDRKDAATRIRLLSTVIDVRNTEGGSAVDVTYVKAGAAHRARARHVVMACYAHMWPHLCPEMPDAQKEALSYAIKTPLVYTNVALRNWRAFKEAKTYRIYSPQSFFHSTTLDFPVSMGDYAYASNPNDPIIATMHHAPISPGEDLGFKEQCRRGRAKLYQLTFDDFEQNVVSQLTGALGAFGFDAERDIAGITVNRWPHGYAYEYNELEDDWTFGVKKGPHIAGRARIGRIAMANSDSEASAYVNGAIDAAHRAVEELIAL